MHTVDLEPYQHSGTNITGIRIVNPESPFMEDLMTFLAKDGPEDENVDEESEVDNADEDSETGNDDEDAKSGKRNV